MSPEPIALQRAPRAVQLVEGGAEACFERALERERAAAHARGLSEGAEHAWSSGAELLAAAAERVEKLRAEAVEHSSRTAIELALEIAKHLLRAEVRAGRHDIEKIVREMLAAAGTGRSACQVHLHPKDAERMASVRMRAGTEIVADIGVQLGDVHVSTAHGLLVRDLDEMLAAIGARLREELAE